MQACKIKYADDADRQLWDRYIQMHPRATLFHRFAWREVIAKTYGHMAYFLIAIDAQAPAERAVGVLPLVNLNYVIFGNHLISLPFLDGGGILADTVAVEKSLLSEAIRLGRKINASSIELRHQQPLACWDEIDTLCLQQLGVQLPSTTRTHKVRMVLKLPETAEMLMPSFKSKLRSQIRKPLKEGLRSQTGGIELLSDFYQVFSANMRDLGSPVHSVKLMRYVLAEFAECAKIIVIYQDKTPVAASLITGFNKTLFNPWASSLRKYARLSPNMLLYLRMLEYACDHGYTFFDFGRSSPGEGTYKFKEQWGAMPIPLNWHYVAMHNKPISQEGEDKNRFEKAIRYWRKLPVPVTRFIGPGIRKYIGL